ncbi:helix-turn-helix domain-containing protein [Pedobacter arcticus]|uniref:helix-turn-helix domain-containing protein n=1 Tax=Pedobacter arcticus TaxID=752140 RepID=UPI00031965E0|nr:helix-turn-helix transcriptional regulator [Pedobacter arcticus]
MVNPGDKLRQLRQKGNIKQTTIAHLLEVSQGKISSIEKNSSPLNTKQLLVLAEFFKISPTYFFETDDSPKVSENEECLKRIQAILTDFKQTSENFKQQLVDKNTIITLQSLHVGKSDEMVKSLELKVGRIKSEMKTLKEEVTLLRSIVNV